MRAWKWSIRPIILMPFICESICEVWPTRFWTAAFQATVAGSMAGATMPLTMVVTREKVSVRRLLPFSFTQTKEKERTKCRDQHEETWRPNLPIQEKDANGQIQDTPPHVMQRLARAGNDVHVRRHQRHGGILLDAHRVQLQRLLEQEADESPAVHGDELERGVLEPDGRDGQADVYEHGGADEAAGDAGGPLVGGRADEEDNGLDEEGLGKGEAAEEEARDDTDGELAGEGHECAGQEGGRAFLGSWRGFC